MRSILAILFLFLLGPFAPAAPLADDYPVLPEGFRMIGEGRVSHVFDGDTVRMADGERVRLVGVQAPELPDDPWARQAKAGLEALVLDRVVTLWGGTTTRDRHGRTLAHIVRSGDGLWIQGELLVRGLARAYVFRDNRMGADALLAWEEAARKERRGLWTHPDYTIVPADKAESVLRSFAIIEGRVLDVAVVRGRTYLNFGANWRTDFTIRVERPARRLFDAEGLDLDGIERSLIRVRGWVRWENGPLIEASHPEQIEILEPGQGFGTMEGRGR